MKKTITVGCIGVTVTCILSLGRLAAADQTVARPTAFDIASMSAVSGVQISPDGKTIVYALSTNSFDSTAKYDEDNNLGGWTMKQQLWSLDVENQRSKQLTYGKKDRSPQWSPDGRQVAFLRKERDTTELFIMAVDGGEGRKIDLGELEPSNHRWSPDGSTIAFTAIVPRTNEEKEQEWRSGGMEVFEGEWRSSQIWTVSVDGGKVVQVTHGSDHVNEYRWSPDGQGFAVLMAKSSDPYIVSNFLSPQTITASGSLLKKLEPEPISATQIQFSPNGQYLSYICLDRGLSLMHALRVHDLTTGEISNPAQGTDWTILDHVWAADSKSILVHTIDRTVSGLHQLSLDGQIKDDIDIQHRVLNWQAGRVDKAGRYLACLSQTATEPDAISLLDLKKSELQVLRAINAQTKDWALADAEVVSWTNAEGVELEGVLYNSSQADSGEGVPLLVLPHGGPDWVSMEYFSTWAHFFSARGYSVFRPNYRGGIGYGFSFYEANRGRLGEIEWVDIESGVDHLIATGRADPEHLVYGGWSWGGYLTAWAIGHTDRYRAAVVGAGVIDVRSQYVTSDINHGIAGQWEYRGNPWQEPENFERSNPVRFLERATTPTLIIHGREDKRVGFEQGITLYRALHDVGCTVKFLTYPREPHGFEEPAHIVGMLNAWADWYVKYDTDDD